MYARVHHFASLSSPIWFYLDANLFVSLCHFLPFFDVTITDDEDDDKFSTHTRNKKHGMLSSKKINRKITRAKGKYNNKIVKIERENVRREERERVLPE